jgi:hypothetical protein
MLSPYFFGNLVMYFFSLILCNFLAPYSLLHYVLKYDISQEQIQIFLQRLSFPYTLFALNHNGRNFVTVDRILDNPDEFKQLSATRLQFERFTWILWPSLFAFAGIYRLTLPSQLFVDNVVIALLMIFGLFIALRFGSSLRHQK